MTDKEMELLPCPVSWCIDPRPQKFTSGNLHYIRCNECGTKTPLFYSSTQAIAAWNTRATSLAAQDGLAEALEHEGQFLLDRIDQLDWSLEPDDFAREWNGHVEPPLARFRDALSAIKGDKS